MCNNISEGKDSSAYISTLQTFSKLICTVAANTKATEPRVLLWVCRSHDLVKKFYGRHHDLIDLLWNICVTYNHGYCPLVVNTSRYFPHWWLITGFVTRLTRRVSLVEQELLTLPEHLNSPPVVSGVRVTRFLVLCVCFEDRCLSFLPLLCLFFDIRILITPLVSPNCSFSEAISLNHFRIPR